MSEGLTLIIMAAGMGSRYGGLKQIDAFGPNGETILEYSIYDAIQSGFDHVVLVIRESFHEQFQEVLGSRFDDQIKVTYVFQVINPTIEGFDLVQREKPRGTGHAVLAAKDVVESNFCVINADDYYGKDAFGQMSTYLSKKCKKETCSMVGYVLKNTLSPHGTVNRGICDIAENGTLTDVHERLKIEQNSPTTVINPNGHKLPLDSIVSVNFFGFHHSFFGFLEQEFHAFLAEHGKEEKYEFYLPHALNSFIHKEDQQCDMMVTQDKRHGVTYADDKPVVKEAIQGLVSSGVYPSPLREVK